MNAPPHPTLLRKRAQVALFGAVLGLTLWAGLDPKDYRFRNDVTWIPDQAGLRFGKYAVAATQPFLSSQEAASLNANGWTLELALELASPPPNGFNIIAAFHNGDTASQWIVGQWRTHLIVMNGDDYSHRRRTPRLTLDTSEAPPGSRWVTLTAGPGGTQVYLNGKRAATSPRWTPRIPAGRVPARLILGNGADCTQSFQGDLLGLAWYDRVLSKVEIEHHAAEWQETRDISSVQTGDSRLLYCFNEGRGVQAPDRSGRGVPLEIPARMSVPHRRVLGLPSPPFESRRHALADVLLNLLGFVPLGYLMVSLSGGVGRLTPWRAVLLVVVLGTLLSFGIELAQAWIPSRDSSLLDLMLNSAGTFLGAILFVVTAGKSASAKARLSSTHAGPEPGAPNPDRLR